MKTGNKHVLAAFLAVLVLLLSVIGCEEQEIPGLTDEEAEQVLIELLPRSVEIMHLFFGEGLAYEQPEQVIEYDGVQYEPVQPGQAYSSIAQMRAALENLYASRYRNDLCILMFDGYETPETTGSDEDEVLDETILPRYREVDGVLQIDIKYQSLSFDTVPSAAGAKVIRGNAERVVVEVYYTSESKGNGTMRVNLALDGGGWLLDGPTY